MQDWQKINTICCVEECWTIQSSIYNLFQKVNDNKPAVFHKYLHYSWEIKFLVLLFFFKFFISLSAADCGTTVSIPKKLFSTPWNLSCIKKHFSQWETFLLYRNFSTFQIFSSNWGMFLPLTNFISNWGIILLLRNVSPTEQLLSHWETFQTDFFLTENLYFH